MWGDNRRRLLALGATVAALAFSTQAAASGTARAAGGCEPVWTDPSGDAYEELPYQGAPAFVGFYQSQLDLVSGTVWRSGPDLVVRIHAAGMGPKLPDGFGGESWESFLQIGSNTIDALAQYDLTGTQYGFFVNNQGFHPASGVMVTGADGYVEIDVPLAGIGSPPDSTPVTPTLARSLEWVDAGVTPQLGVLTAANYGVLGSDVDHATGGSQTTVGAACP